MRPFLPFLGGWGPQSRVVWRVGRLGGLALERSARGLMFVFGWGLVLGLGLVGVGLGSEVSWEQDVRSVRVSAFHIVVPRFFPRLSLAGLEWIELGEGLTSGAVLLGAGNSS